MIKRKTHVYVAIIDDGLSWRGFRSLPFMCELFSLDPNVVRKELRDKGYWVGLKMTIFAVEIETHKKHKGRL